MSKSERSLLIVIAVICIILIVACLVIATLTIHEALEADEPLPPKSLKSSSFNEKRSLPKPTPFKLNPESHDWW